jgi:signal transduction histidine kinase
MQTELENSIIIALVAAFSIFILSGILMYIVYHTQQKLKEKQAQLYKAVIEAQELEQQRIGRDLHDEVGPLLTLLKFSLEKYGDESLESKELVTQAIANIRSAAHNLMPPDISKFGIISSLEKLCQNFNAQTTVDVSFVSRIKDITLQNWYNIHIYRIVAELITNALKHAEASQIVIQLKEKDHHLHISIMDDGLGLDTSKTDLKDGIGWQNIQHRLKLINSKYTLTTEPNNGTQISLIIPLE